MTPPARRRMLLYAAVAVVADAVSKTAAVHWLSEPISLGFIDLRVTRNPGLAFSLGADQPAAVVIAITATTVVALLFTAWRGHLGTPVHGGLVVGGGLANLLDRLIGGSVVDLFDLGWWPVFNLADVFIIVGVALLLLHSISRDEDDDHRDAGDATGPGEGHDTANTA